MDAVTLVRAAILAIRGLNSHIAAMTEPTMRTRKCPICGKPAQEPTRPFCSDRCKMLDLNRWLSGAYRIPAASDEDDEDGTPSEA